MALSSPDNVELFGVDPLDVHERRPVNVGNHEEVQTQ